MCQVRLLATFGTGWLGGQARCGPTAACGCGCSSPSPHRLFWRHSVPQLTREQQGSCPPQWRRQQVSTRQCSTLFSPRSSAAASASPLAVTFFAGFYCTWHSILVSGSPERGLQKGSAARCCVTGRQLTDARVLLAVAGAENVPHARREVTHALLAKHGKTGECLMMVQCSCTNLPFFLSSLVHQQAAFEKNTPEARGTGSTEAASSRAW